MKQYCIVYSTMEVEYIATSEVIKKLFGLRSSSLNLALFPWL